MKRFFTLALALTTFATATFADNTKSINDKVRTSFSRTFTNAQDVSWEVKNNLFKATFKKEGKTMYAYYDEFGDQVAISRNLHMDQLPLSLSAELRGKFEASWLTELFEVSANDETAYYATIENATHITTYKAVGTSGWALFSKEKKK